MYLNSRAIYIYIYILLDLSNTISNRNPPKVFLHFIYPTLINNILCNFLSLWQIDLQNQDVQSKYPRHQSSTFQNFSFFVSKQMVYHMYLVSLETTTSPSTLLLREEEAPFEHRAHWQHFWIFLHQHQTKFIYYL